MSKTKKILHWILVLFNLSCCLMMFSFKTFSGIASGIIFLIITMIMLPFPPFIRIWEGEKKKSVRGVIGIIVLFIAGVMIGSGASGETSSYAHAGVHTAQVYTVSDSEESLADAADSASSTSSDSSAGYTNASSVSNDASSEETTEASTDITTPATAPTDTPAPAATQSETASFNLSDIPAYAGNPYVAVNNNVPYFLDADLTTASYEHYGDLDALGRCTAASASIGQDLMPTEPRGDIGEVKPTGWHTVKYNGIEGNYLYNRCHLIGYQLTGENANEKNLITGTRYLNVDGMEPFENMTADYIKETGNHVLYRVTPVFEGNNALASGVLMEGESVEDKGAGVLFCVYCYNVQPGITIDYATGDSSGPAFTGSGNQESENQGSNTQNSGNQTSAQGSPAVTQATQTQQEAQTNTAAYIGNSNTHKFHRPDCTSVGRMSEKNKVSFGSREEAVNAGYEPCKICNP
ncbi:MAG: DNA/RNA non-specific endonuclease [Eubacterium sp.]|nr:DNA/RNA non-specific endonuclease [Eubacterium sp.]